MRFTKEGLLVAVRLETSSLEVVFAKQEYMLRKLMDRLFTHSSYYRNLLRDAGIDPGDIKSIKDLSHVPFTEKEKLRELYPLGLMAVNEEDVVRIHSSSGTTGKPVIVPYTRKDVETWAEMFSRCYHLVGINKKDRVQVTPGYGLWTAGIGFQAGVERLGAMAIPTGPGNTEKQLEMMIDLKTTVLCATSSYALLLAEEINRRGLKDQIKLKIGVFGSERWGDKMRSKIEDYLGLESFDIYGLTEIYGPGIAIECSQHEGMHFWSDHLLFEIIDPVTGKQLPPGEQGELVITTLTKEGMPLLRYRTHDITRIIPHYCTCGSEFPMIDQVLGRTDDMVKIKGVNIYPGQIDHTLHITEGCSSEYQIHVTREHGKDKALVKVEMEKGCRSEEVSERLIKTIKAKIGVIVDVEMVPLGSLGRTEKKSKRVFDLRYE
ncbi:MAG: phenylacetate--CoA ligase family protein [Bacillota bacterium]